MNDYQKGYINALDDFAKMIKDHLNTADRTNLKIQVENAKIEIVIKKINEWINEK